MNDQELLRYNRHILLPQIDVEGQEKICQSKMLIVGVGGLGSPVSMYLAASGVGELFLVDDDKVDESNLQRQIVHNENTLGLPKVESARKNLTELNSFINVRIFDRRLDDQGLLELIYKVDVVLDCSDNFQTRKQLNRLCYQNKKPLVSGAAIRLEGQLTTFLNRDENQACYACLYEVSDDENLSCAQNGVLAPVVGIVGAAQALEAIKIITGCGEPLSGILGLFDGATNKWRYLNFKKNPQCLVCNES